MSDQIALDAQPRTGRGKSAARALRKKYDMVPAIVYSGNSEPTAVQLAHKDISRALERESIYSQVLTLRTAGQPEQVVLKQVHRHPAKARILHVDFMRISAGQRVSLHVPVHFLNEERCIGVKEQGGLLTHTSTSVELRGLPEALPEYIEVDVAALGIGDTIHISDLTLSEGVESVALTQGTEHDSAIVNVISPRGGIQEEAEEAAEAAAEAAEAAVGDGDDDDDDETESADTEEEATDS